MPTTLLALLSPKNVILFVIVLTRLSGMISTAPLISAYPIPVQVKVWFMATVTFIMFPIVLAKTGFHVPTNMPELIIILLKEFLIGYITGFIANVVFMAVEIAANLVSMQIGLTAAQAMNPLTGDTSPVLSQAYTLLASMVFIGINGFHWMFSAIYKTFQLVPPGYSVTVSGHFVNSVIFFTSEMFTIGIGIALPLFAVLMITDILLGFTAKMMPKMNIFMVALPVKIYLGFVLFIMLMPQICSQLALLFEKHLGGIITVFGG